MQLKKLVYRHIRLDNNKVFYIGIGNEKRPYSKNNRNKHWLNVVNKTNYYVEVVSKNLSLEDACELEVFLISEYGIGNLTNINSGGEGQFNPDAETRYKIGSGKRGTKISKEHKIKLSQFNKGKKHTEEAKQKIKENHKLSKKVLDLQTGIFYDSLTNACYCTNIKYSAEHLRITRYKKNYRFIYI
jgi:hypothetical protein